MFQEYPKALYKGDSYRAMEDAEQEQAARADGWHDFGQAPKAADAAQTDAPATAKKPATKAPKAADAQE